MAPATCSHMLVAGDHRMTPLVPRGQYEQQTTATRAERMHWWREARFGMFVHLGHEGREASCGDLRRPACDCRLPAPCPHVGLLSSRLRNRTSSLRAEIPTTVSATVTADGLAFHIEASQRAL